MQEKGKKRQNKRKGNSRHRKADRQEESKQGEQRIDRNDAKLNTARQKSSTGGTKTRKEIRRVGPVVVESTKQLNRAGSGQAMKAAPREEME